MSTTKQPKKVKIVGAHIEGARGLLGMSQTELAAASGVLRETITGFEAGKHRPRLATLAKLVKALEERGIEFSNGTHPGVKLFPERATVPIRERTGTEIAT